MGRLTELDALRAAAVLAVIAFHSDLSFAAGGGYVGVELFFVISGFLIAHLLLSEVTRDGRVRVFAFYARRFLRLWPPLAAMVGLTVLAGLLLAHDLPHAFAIRPIGDAALAAASLNADLFVYYGHVDTEPFVHTWSLGVEAKYYLLWPVVTVWAARSAVPRRTVAMAGLTLVVLGATLAAVRWQQTHNASLLQLPDAHLYAVGIGSAAGALAGSYRLPRHIATAGLLLSAAGLLAVVVAGPGPAVLLSGGGVAVSLTGAALVISVSDPGLAAWARRLLNAPPAQYVGQRSYSLYLWHFPIFHALPTSAFDGHRVISGVVRLGVTFAAAIASYRLIEQPSIRFGHRVTGRTGAPGRLGFPVPRRQTADQPGQA